MVLSGLIPGGVTQNIVRWITPVYISGHMLLINNYRFESTPKISFAGVEIAEKTHETLSIFHFTVPRIVH